MNKASIVLGLVLTTIALIADLKSERSLLRQLFK